MRIQNLAVIFVIIILPITLVMQSYIRNLTNVTNIEARYNEILRGSTYDAVRAYQMNTINNDYSGVNTSRQRDIKASVNSFFNSLATGLHKSGSTKSALNEYIPAILFNLYDGFYVYGPYNNVASVGIDNNGDGIEEPSPEEGKITNKRPFFNENVSNTENSMYGVKPFTYYSCEYADTGYDITINYTLDNYIAVSGTVGDKQISGAGYYINADGTTVVDTVADFLNNSIHGGDTVTAPGGIKIKAEALGEYISFYDRISVKTNTSSRIINDMNGAVYARYYRYINYNNTKYYFDDWVNTENTTYSADSHTPPIFTLTNHCRNYISLDQLITLATYEGWRDQDGNIIRKDEGYNNAAGFSDYIKSTPSWADTYFKDVNPYYYYKKAKEFSKEMNKYLKNIDLSKNDVIKNKSFNEEYDMTTRTGERVSDKSKGFTSYTISKYQNKNVFDYSDSENNPELDSSSFNAHRIDVIAKTIESALIKTISSLNDYYGSNAYVYEMPTISMNDWNSIANGITVAAFMQGVPIGNYKFFNNYCIIGNTTNKEFVSKDAVYVQPKYGERNPTQMNYTKDSGGVYATIGRYSLESGRLQGFCRKLSYMNFPTMYKTQGLGYNTLLRPHSGESDRVLTQHNPQCGDLIKSTDTEFIAYRRNDYLIESYEHTYEDYRLGEPKYLSERAKRDGYYILDSGKLKWKEDVSIANSNGLWYYNDNVNSQDYGKLTIEEYDSNNDYQKAIAHAINYDDSGTLKKTYVQQINYYPQYGTNAYECIVSHNGYKFTYDQILKGDYASSGITDPAEIKKFQEMCSAYATCLAREKAVQYKNLDTMNYHRIFMQTKDNKMLSIATRKSGEEIGVLAFKGKNNTYWNVLLEGDILPRPIKPDDTMPYYDIYVNYNGGDDDKAFGK